MNYQFNIMNDTIEYIEISFNDKPTEKTYGKVNKLKSVFLENREEKSLIIARCRYISLIYIGDCPHMEYIYITGNYNLNSVSIGKNMKSLKYIYINKTKKLTIYPQLFSNMNTFISSDIKNFSVFFSNYFPNLNVLGLDNCIFQNKFSIACNMNDLTIMQIISCGLKDFINDNKIDNLEILNLRNNNIREAKSKYPFNKLRVVDLSYNNIKEVSSILPETLSHIKSSEKFKLSIDNVDIVKNFIHKFSDINLN